MQIEDDFFVQRNLDNEFKVIDPAFERTKTKKMNISDKKPAKAIEKTKKP